MSFGSDLRKIAARRNLDLRKISRTVPLRIFDAVARDTRVDTGRLKGNWQVADGAPVLTVIDRLDNESGAGIAASEAAKIKPFSTTYLTNNLPYAPVWEEEDGTVKLALADFKRIVRREAAKYGS